MPFQLPPAVNYPSPLVALVARYLSPPREGNRMVPLEIVWGIMGGVNHCVAVNLQNNATLDFSQIIALSIDNSDCGADVRFVFPDTAETLTIPAYAPKVICEVFTNQVQFFIVAGFNNEVVETADTTRISIHNSLPPPIAVPVTQEQQTASVTQVVIDGATPIQVVPAGVNGTLQGIQIFVSSPITTTGSVKFTVQDGVGKIIAQTSVNGSVGNQLDQIILDLGPIAVRFTNGIKILQSGVNFGGFLNCNVQYRTP